MKNLKRVLSLVCIAVMMFSLSVFAFEQDEVIPFKLKASKTTISAGETFTLTLYADVETPVDYETGAIMGTIDYNSDEFTVSSEGVDTANIAVAGAPTGSKTNGIVFQYMSNKTINSASAFTFEITAASDLADGNYTLELANFQLCDTSYSVTTTAVNDVLTITVGAAGPTYPSLSEDTFTEGEEVFDDDLFNGATATTATKGITVFNKTVDALTAGTYGIKVVNDSKTYTFAGLYPVAENGTWAIKIIAPAGTFSDGVEFNPTSIKAYDPTGEYDELVK